MDSSDALPLESKKLSRNNFRHKIKTDRRRIARGISAIQRQQRRKKREEHENTPEALREKEEASRIHEAARVQWELREKEIEENNAKRKLKEENKRKRQNAIKVGLAKASALAKKLEKTFASSVPTGPTLPDVSLFTNPSAPPMQRSRQPAIPATEIPLDVCHYFAKTGMCRLGEECGKTHAYPISSSTLLFRNIFDGPRTFVGDDELEGNDDEDDVDIDSRYIRFYNDIFPQLRKFGLILQFQCCRNRNRPYHGSLYVQYANEEQARIAKSAISGRYHSGRRICAVHSPSVKWHAAICGLFARGCCPNGDDCELIHLYYNPNGVFQEGILENRPPGKQIIAPSSLKYQVPTASLEESSGESAVRGHYGPSTNGENPVNPMITQRPTQRRRI